MPTIVPYTPVEKTILFNLIRKFTNVLENKKTDATSNSEKKETWIKIAQLFNSSRNVSKRDTTQLKRCWEKHKSQVRKRKLLERRQALSTGEGKPFQTSPVEDKITPQGRSQEPFLNVEVDTPQGSDHHHLKDAAAASTSANDHLLSSCAINSTPTSNTTTNTLPFPFPILAYPSSDSPSPPPQSSPTQTPAIDKQLSSWETFTTDPTSRTFTPGGSNRLTSQPSVGKPCHSSGEIFHESSTHFVEIETKVRLGQMQELHNLKLKQEAELHEIKVEIEKTRLREAQLAIEIKEIQLARLNTNEHCGSY